MLALGARGVGLDIGAEQVRAVLLKKRRQQFVLAGIGLSQIPQEADDLAVAEAVKSALREAGARKSDPVCSAVGGPAVVVKGIKVPPIPLPRVLEAVKWDFREHGLVSDEDLIFDAQILGKSADGQMSILAVCAPQEMVEHHQRILSMAGVTPQKLDVESLAILNALLTLQGFASEETLVLLGMVPVIPFLCVYHREAGAPLVRYFQDQNQSASVAVEEIRTTVAYFQSRFAIGSALRCVQCGEERIFAELKREMQGLLALWNHQDPPAAFDPLSILEWEKSILPAGKSIEGPQLAQAVGLAMRML